jgi:hypothetical protein
LNANSSKYDKEEEAIIEETLKHVVLLFSKLSRVDLIEYLHQHECLEHYGVQGYLVGNWVIKVYFTLLIKEVEAIKGFIIGKVEKALAGE